MKRIVLTLLATAFVATTMLASMAFAEVPTEVTFEAAKMGTVTFNHTAHQEVSDCATCHHKGVEAGSCRSCHGVDAAAPDMKKASHDMCKGCHKEKGAPTGCKDCHKK